MINYLFQEFEKIESLYRWDMDCYDQIRLSK